MDYLELKECPFCENKDIKLYYWDSALIWKLECVVCHASCTHKDKEKVIKLWNTRPKEDSLQRKFKMDNTVLQEKCSKLKKEYEDLESTLKTIQEDSYSIKTSFNDIQQKYSTLQRVFDETTRKAKEEYDILKARTDKKLNDEQVAHKYYVSTMQTRIDEAEKILLDIISTYNAKLTSIKLDEYKISSEIMDKIRK